SDFFRKDFDELIKINLNEAHLHLEPDDVPEYKRKTVKLAGIVTMLLEKKNKEGQAFLVFKIEDGMGELELALFHKQYTALQNPIKLNEALFVECKIKRGIEQGSVKGVVQSVTKLSQKRVDLVKRITLNTNHEFLDEKLNLKDLEKLLEKNKGNTPLYLNVLLGDEQARIKARLGNHNVMPTDEFIFAVEQNWPGLVTVERGYQHETNISAK
ncbi:MAG: hypothetical protein V4591_06450, partial [Bdellovibrionota bacterium]